MDFLNTAYKNMRSRSTPRSAHLSFVGAVVVSLFSTPVFSIDVSGGVTLSVTQISKWFGGSSLDLWVYCVEGGSGPGSCTEPTLPGPLLELGAGAQANITLTVPAGVGEAPPYDGHTLYFQGLDLPQAVNGIPETGAGTTGDTYRFSVDTHYVGGHMYFCHVHTVKHLEMGMYGPMVVRAVDAGGNFLPLINGAGPAYDVEWNLVLSTIDPRYHSASGDDTVFASYNPLYFLINGKEGFNHSLPADTLSTRAGTTVAIRLMGLHSVNATFAVLDSAGVPQTYTLYNVDGFALNTPLNTTEIEIAPGQSKDIMITLPATAGVFYPQVVYRSLRNDSRYTTVYTTLTFN